MRHILRPALFSMVASDNPSGETAIPLAFSRWPRKVASVLRSGIEWIFSVPSMPVVTRRFLSG